MFETLWNGIWLFWDSWFHKRLNLMQLQTEPHCSSIQNDHHRYTIWIVCTFHNKIISLSSKFMNVTVFPTLEWKKRATITIDRHTNLLKNLFNRAVFSPSLHALYCFLKIIANLKTHYSGKQLTKHLNDMHD